MKIIVRMPNWLGDFVMAEAALAEIKRALPQSKLWVYGKKDLLTLLEKDPHVDGHIYPNNLKSWHFNLRESSRGCDDRKRGNIDEYCLFSDRTTPGLWRGRNANFSGCLGITETIQKRFDVGILLTNSFSSAFHFFRSGVKSRIGYARDFRSFFLTVPLKMGGGHQVEIYKKLLSPLGIEDSGIRPKLFVGEDEVKKAKETLFRFGWKGGRLLGICMGAAYGRAKRWPESRFIGVADEMMKRGWEVAFLGSGEESFPAVDGAINLIGKTSLREFIATVSVLDRLLSNDSGPMHVAAALDISLVAIFGSTSFLKTGPYMKAGAIYKKVECSPCFKRSCKKGYICMDGITVDEVLAKCLEA